jgi:hypothetical protein
VLVNGQPLGVGVALALVTDSQDHQNKIWTFFHGGTVTPSTAFVHLDSIVAAEAMTTSKISTPSCRVRKTYPGQAI